MTRAFSVAAGLALLACGACASQASGVTDPGPRLGVAALDLVTASGGFPARARVLTLAEERLVQECMARRGHTYWPITPEPVTGSDEQRTVDLPGRRAHGYGLAVKQPGPPRVGPDEDKPPFQRAMFGDRKREGQLRLPNGSTLSFPTSGCVPEARATLYGDQLLWARVDAVPQVVRTTLRAEGPELTKARAQWAACMATAGYRYTDSRAAVADLAAAYQRENTPALRAREIAVATADGECALRAHVPSTESALRRAQAQRLPAAERREISELAEAHCAAYRRAEGVLGTSTAAPPCPAVFRADPA
ncbi:hypothetical protein OG320_14105 [Microbispora sp. NBC_01189]|uniref:hypothetical protein n=1 Tax=Microbispora sp. NBC_01189 TaxID=2903583 RepID=UPI002E132A79|nr:hypothetical protein OG320_14105 [Microbispora sp. NBC_01189]